MNQHHLPVTRTARYYTIGTPSADTRHIWFCLHGFGQLAAYFGRKFSGLASPDTLIVIPEGLSRLYLDNTYTRVGASWLTREDRDAEIADFTGYLNALYDQVLDGRDPAALHISLLGFSQGAATACRWLASGHIRVDRLILWAGYFPEGLQPIIDPSQLANREVHYVYGRQDEYIQAMPDPGVYLARLQADVPTMRITAFDGGHRVEPAVLAQLIA
ncbi:esterase [Spirosoma luteolum]